MSRQRKRHSNRQPIEETVRLSISDLVGNAGGVDVERHQYDWRSDDLLVWIRLKDRIQGATLELLKDRLLERMGELLPNGEPLDEWMVVAELEGETIFRMSWYEQTNPGRAGNREA
jgi:hypothetical protein